MIRPNAAPSPVRHRHQRAARARLEGYLDLRAFGGREGNRAPFEDQARWRIPRRDAPRVEHSRLASALEGLEQATAHARLEADESALRAGDAYVAAFRLLGYEP